MLNFLFAERPIFEVPSLLELFLNEPTKVLIRLVHFLVSLLRTPPPTGQPPVCVVCISDTHCQKAAIPDGDLLIHAGDLTDAGTPSEIQAQIDWLNSLPHKHKVVIAGNHDTFLDPSSRQTLPLHAREGSVDWKGLWYLQHSAVTFKFHNGRREVKIYGAPQIPECGPQHFAFQYAKGHDAWSGTIPQDTEILITHTPPKYHLDLPVALGCEFLLREVWKVRPRLHVFGHIHAGKSDALGLLKGGRETVAWDEGQRCVERAMSRPSGLIRSAFDPRSWLDLVRVSAYGAAGVLWDWVWGGKTDKTIMVNAALMYCNTGYLRNPPQVVII